MNINASLSALGAVILALCENAKQERAEAAGSASEEAEARSASRALASGPTLRAHRPLSSSKPGKGRFVPYRNSVLTWILRDSMGGNARTIMFANVSPNEQNRDETLNTLRFVKRAKNIAAKPLINVKEAPVDQALLRALQAELYRAKQGLIQCKAAEGELVRLRSVWELPLPGRGKADPFAWLPHSSDAGGKQPRVQKELSRQQCSCAGRWGHCSRSWSWRRSNKWRQLVYIRTSSSRSM